MQATHTDTERTQGGQPLHLPNPHMQNLQPVKHNNIKIAFRCNNTARHKTYQ